MRKKLYLVLSLLLLASMILTACKTAEPTATQAPEPTEPPEETQAPEETEEPADPNDLGGITINVAVENAYPPYNFIDEETNEPMGWDYDAVRAMCELLNCVPVFVEAAWEGIFEATAAGEYDMVADGVTCSGADGAARREVIDFSIVYGSSFQVIIVRAGETDITDEASLIASDAMVGTQIGTTNETKAIEMVGENRVLSYDTFDLPVTALIAGDVDAVVMDGSAAESFLAQNPDDIMILPEPITGAEDFCFVFPQGSDLVAPFNYAIEALRADGTLDDLEAKWWPQE